MESLREYITKKIQEKGLNINIILDLLGNDSKIRWTIHNDFERKLHEDDIRDEIDFMNSEYKEDCKEKGIESDIDKLITLTNEELEEITDIYEENLGNDTTWHEYRKEAINEFLNKKRGN